MHFVEAYICRSFITCRCDYLKTIIQVEYSIYQIYSILQYSTVELLHLNQFNEKFLKLLCTLSKLIEIFTRLSGVDHIGLVVNVYLSAGPKLDDWRQRVLTLWPCGMEQSSFASAERRLHPIIRLFQKTLEDGPVQTDHPKIIIQ